MQDALKLQMKLLNRISLLSEQIPESARLVNKEHKRTAYVIKQLCKGVEAISIITTMEPVE